MSGGLASPSPGVAAPRPLAGRTVSVFGSSTLRTHEPGWELAEALGRALARAGADVMTGGYGGAMEAVSQGARSAGGHVVGVTVEIFPERSPNRHLSEQRHTATLLERLGVLLGADGFVVLDGSVGTLAEFFLAWNHVMFEAPRRPLVCLGAGWPEKLRLLRDGRLVGEERLFELVEVAADPADAVRRLGERKGAGS